MNSTDVFSMPYGTSMTYPPFPYEYRNCRSVNIVYEAQSRDMEKLLPPGVELADDLPLVSSTYGYYPDTTPFGSYREFWFYVRVQFEGKTFMFNPLMYVNSDSSMACGRELWGYPKKMAHIEADESGDVITFTADRPAGNRLVDIRFKRGHQSLPKTVSEITFPSLMLRLIQNPTGIGEPDIAQLITSFNAKNYHRDASGNELCWSGEVEFSVGTGTVGDPVHFFAPGRIIETWTSIWDADLPVGDIAHDYRAKG